MQFRRRPPLAAALALVLALTLWGQAAQAQSLVLSNLVVDNQSGALTARFGVALDSLAEVTDVLQSGVPLALSCRGKLIRQGGIFSSPQVAAAEMVCRLKYDSLTREYALIMPGREAPLKNARLDELLRSGWGALTLDMGSWKLLERGKTYTLTLDINLQQTDIPNWFKRTLFFWSRDMAPQATYQLHFKY
ncbi:MAG: DUF4390 domain-containing protein [Humidesulfovibrio sp.]|uniref:DUF4390 domain-containing protein n=1 Tax=Humidesulfovibrio sp. TaxID=2910988 RepID=UPI0027342F9F|nr:DUF4390 domain-containing protein [Humidesulfovibrio sp.]MDP2846920.1 DUF4390 domain-containing protein [Humidesulfovibrio sp.]